MKEDEKKAVAWFTKSAEQGNADAQFELSDKRLTKEIAQQTALRG